MKTRRHWKTRGFWTGLAKVALAACIVVPAHADECSSLQTQAELDQCAGEAFGKADSVLNSTYKTAMEHLRAHDAGKALLVDAQKAWLVFRDGECAFEASSSIGGSVHSMLVTQCKTTLTKSRTQALRRLLSCSESDLDCPIPLK